MPKFNNDFHVIEMWAYNFVCCSATLLAFLVELLKSSVAMQEQMLGGKGFLVIGYLLEKVSEETCRMKNDVLLGRLGDLLYLFILFFPSPALIKAFKASSFIMLLSLLRSLQYWLFVWIKNKPVPSRPSLLFYFS